MKQPAHIRPRMPKTHPRHTSMGWHWCRIKQSIVHWPSGYHRHMTGIYMSYVCISLSSTLAGQQPEGLPGALCRCSPAPLEDLLRFSNRERQATQGWGHPKFKFHTGSQVLTSCTWLPLLNTISKLGTTYSTYLYEILAWLRLLVLWLTYRPVNHAATKVTYDLLIIYLFCSWFTTCQKPIENDVLSAKWNVHIWNRLRECYSSLYTGTLRTYSPQHSNFQGLKFQLKFTWQPFAIVASFKTPQSHSKMCTGMPRTARLPTY